MYFAIFCLLLAIPSASAVQCYVGEIPWRSGAIEASEFYPNGIVMPTLVECPESASCCSIMDYLVDQRYSCVDDCPNFQGREEIFKMFPTDGGITYCQKPEGSCKFQQLMTG